MLNEEKDSRSKMKKIERRTYTVQDVETRADDDGNVRGTQTLCRGDLRARSAAGVELVPVAGGRRRAVLAHCQVQSF